MILRSSLFVLAVLAGFPSFASAQSPSPAPAQPAQKVATLPSSKKDAEIVDAIKLREVDVDAVLNMLEMLTGRTIIRPAALPATTYTLEMKNPLPRSEAILALETVMGLNGIGISPLGDKFLKVVALNQVRTEAPEMITGSTLGLPPSGRIAAKFFQLEHVRVTEIAPLLQNIVSPGVGVNIISFDKANAAFITDSISNLQRIETLLANIDRAVSSPKFYGLRFAKASELIQKIQAIIVSPQMQAQFANNTTLSADDRSNQIIIVTDPSNTPFFDDMIAKFDVKADPNTKTEVIYLKHANTKDVSSLLTNLISGQSNAASKVGSAQVIQRSVDTPVQQNAAAVQAPTIRLVNSGAPQGQTTTFSSVVVVTPDERTNSIVVSGTLDDIRLIQELVDKVDIILPQVRIEAVIAEVNLTDSDTSGISALGLQLTGNRLTGISGASAGGTLSGTTDSNGKASGMATISGQSLTGLISLSTTPRKDNTRILSSPSIVTTHNKKAVFTVGEEYPVVSSYVAETTSTTTSSGYRTTVSYKAVNLTLTVTPLIGDDGSVQMDIEQEVNNVIANTKIDGNDQPQIGTRKATSFVTAKSGDIVVLGGLQRTSQSQTTSRLGPIPFLGDLLGSRSKSLVRRDLVIFIRPVLVNDSEEHNELYMKRLEADKQDNQVKEAFGEPVLDKKDKTPKAPSMNYRK